MAAALKKLTVWRRLFLQDPEGLRHLKEHGQAPSATAAKAAARTFSTCLGISFLAAV